MFKTSLKLIFRNWWRNKTFTLISILSLTVGIACTNLLGAFVAYEYGIENANPNKNRIIWATQDMPSNPGKKVAYMQKGIPEQLKEKYPEVKNFIQLNSSTLINIEVNHQTFEPIEVLNVNPSFPDFFPFELLYGSWSAFNDPKSIIISETQAKRFFGNENALGKQIVLVEQGFDEANRKEFTIGAVTKTRAQSAIKFDALFCDPENAWGGPTLLMMTQETDVRAFEDKVKKDVIPTLDGGQYYFTTLDKAISQNYNEQELEYWHYRKNALLLVGLVSAILVFLIAVFNYVNISFSRVLQQVKSIHTQKLMGARPVDIRWQLFGDTFLMVFISFVLSLLLLFDILPLFNRIVSAEFNSSFFFSREFSPFFITLLILLTVIPALIMSRKISRLSGNDYRMFFVKKKNYWVSALVTIQFIIAISLIIGMITANQQMNLVKQAGNRYLNLIEIGGQIGGSDLKPLYGKLHGISGITDISMADKSLMNAWFLHGTLVKENGETTGAVILHLSGNDDFLRTIQLRQLSGDAWEKQSEKYAQSVFVNKAFADMAERSIDELIGQPLHTFLETGNKESVIAGVLDNFYFNTLENKASPAMIEYLPSTTNEFTTIQIRLYSQHQEETIAAIRKVWEQTFPDTYFSYIDVYHVFKTRNSKIFEMARLLQMYSLISILLTCFGLFGITFYAVKQRTKEIGIRKINGAKTLQILWLLMKPMFVWITIGFVIAVPLAWWLIERWLQQFVYRVNVSVFSFALAFLAVSAITFATVGWHVWRTARSNPVKSLKSE